MTIKRERLIGEEKVVNEKINLGMRGEREME
jgi:hypothetical protein